MTQFLVLSSCTRNFNSLKFKHFRNKFTIYSVKNFYLINLCKSYKSQGRFNFYFHFKITEEL